jgi:hypothetical protein
VAAVCGVPKVDLTEAAPVDSLHHFLRHERRGVASPPAPSLGESQISRTILRCQKNLILKEAFLIRESLHAKPPFDSS